MHDAEEERDRMGSDSRSKRDAYLKAGCQILFNRIKDAGIQ